MVFLTLTASLRTRIVDAFDRTRRTLPPVGQVSVRPNVRRLASLSGGGGTPARLNLSTAVVEAGEEAWIEIAPALEGDRKSLARLRHLTRGGVVENRRRRRGVRRAGCRASGVRRPPPRTALPPARCQGTRSQRIYLNDLT